MAMRKFAHLRKWNYSTRSYEPFLSPAGFDARLIGDEKDVCRCAECGKKILYGDSYSSIRIHNASGLGYAVCRECNQKEWEERRKWKDQ